MPRKIRELIADLRRAGFREIPGKGSHRKFVHPGYPRTVTVSGGTGDDAKAYQERDVRKALEEVGE